MKDSLPASFRIGKDIPEYFRTQLANELFQFIRDASAYTPQDDDIQDDKRGRSNADFAALSETQVSELSFLPYAYQLSLDRVALRRNPALKQLQHWLTSHAEEGHITRQETVSMIPPVLLQVTGNDRVLDMCAAPGSKTSQILEDMSSSKTSDGYLVANDSNTQRAYLLSHQLRRILYHHPVALITASHAQNFPNNISFNKILCDVPCTGDGTSRKNVDIWLNWSNGGALGLHALQLQIAKRGIDLLQVGGTMCYSTCSQNPIENEAVVAELLRSGGLELVETNVKGFITRPGRTSWKVLFDGKLPNDDIAAANQEAAIKTYNDSAKDTDRPMFEPTSWDNLLTIAASTGLIPYESYDDVPIEMRKKIRPSVFPPSKHEIENFHLGRCLRCLPHDNNTGGFFSAVLKKVKPVTRRDRRRELEAKEEGHKNDDAEPDRKRQKFYEDDEGASKTLKIEEATPADDEKVVVDRAAQESAVALSEAPDEQASNTNDKTNFRHSTRRNRRDLGKDNFVQAPNDIMDSIVDFYGLSTDFPRHLFHYRALGEMKTLYYVSPQVMKLFDQGIQDRITSECGLCTK